MLDAERGGSFELAPEAPFEVERRYLPGTNVLETTFRTGEGSVRVTDALTLPHGGIYPARELQRRVEGLTGIVRMRWQIDARFGYARAAVRRAGRVAASGRDAVALCGDLADWSGTREVAAGERAVLALAFAAQEPLVLPARGELDDRFEHTCGTWKRWAATRTYDGPYRDAVIRSALALKLLLFAPSGAVAAAATASLPEEIGGARNWDYRYSWIRDSAFAVDAFLRLGCGAEAQAYFWWLMHATQLTAPRLHVLYRLDGSTRTPERALPLHGYRGSSPVNIGNGAAGQLQLDTYGELLLTARRYADSGNRIDGDIRRRLRRLADFVDANWRREDAGIWEVRSEPRHFTQSKMMCALALEAAGRDARPVRDFVESQCWSEEKASYVRAAGDEDLDASLLLAAVHGYGDGERLRSTVAAVERELRDGPYVRRYVADDGVAGGEGAFVACSFWLVEALARTGRVDDAAALMDELLGLANDVGLYSEELDPASGEFLGNLPQGLSHLALISAACALAEAA